MKPLPARFPHGPRTGLNAPASFLVSLAVFLLTLTCAAGAHAQGFGRVVPDKEEAPAVRPYILAYGGFGDPMDNAYGEVFDDHLLRIGGGFGMRFRSFGAEVLLRRGGVEQTHLIKNEDDQDQYRTFSYTTTDVQFRLYAVPRVGPLTIPAGFGVGLVNVKVDRGYPGVFDRFGSSGFYIGPFVGIEYPVSKSFTIGVSGEYAMNTVGFNGSEAWQSHYGNALGGRISPPTDASFWDTVGGASNETPADYNFDNGGMLVAVRATIYIPTYHEPDNR